MYSAYFGLSEAPFSIAPNPRYLYMTHQHQEALAHLIYGLQGEGGVVLLTGEVGTGKTTISRKLLEQAPENCDIAWIINPKLSVRELLATICDELSISYPKNYAHLNVSIKDFTDLISARLIRAHSRGRNTVLMIDEAQNLSVDVLEELRLLTNLETNERKLLQIVLLGQPELKAMLEKHELRQLSQRITVRYHLKPLSRFETGEYIRHRLSVAGCDQPLFTDKTINLIHKESQGTPRLINLFCDRILLGLYSQGGREARPEHVRQASIEVFGEPGSHSGRPLLPLLVASALTIAVAVSAAFYFNRLEAQNSADKQTTVMATTEVQAEPVAQPEQVQGGADAADTEPKAENIEQAELDTADAAANEQPVSLFSNDIWGTIEQTGTKMLAFRTLADIWQTELLNADDVDPCDQLVDKKLACLQQQANAWLLKGLNRPAVFELTGSDGRQHYAVIRAIEGDRVTIALELQQWEIDLSELEQHWQNQVTLIWSKPPGYEKELKPGDSGKVIQWLASQLDAVQGKLIPPRAFLQMDALLVDRLTDFQKAQGLPADGIAGPQTLIRINERIGLQTPRLNSRSES
ncbi:MAG: hypothetical protein AUJ57_05905 [Zetaproteobacteria bacterium CG1_02_53_45]|nr:MAG: hypothetical protein AUJ57_05905 [Zetaproteobacteria bacterium CG1_02_53_45]